MVKIILWWIGVPLVLAFVIFIGYVLMRVAKSGTSVKTNNFRSQMQKGAKWLWEKAKHPAFFIVIGIAIINWLIWALDAEFWMSIWKTQAKFWAINIASLAAVWLLFIKDESKKTNPVALTFSKIIGGIVGLILVTCIWNFMTSGGDLRIPFFGNKTSVENLSRGVSTVPLEVAKRVVCECETNCQQFEKNKDGNFVLDGEGKKIPTRNKGIPSKGIKPSTAFGKYQFLEIHREPAKKLGYDLNTEEGQDKYFAYLYAKDEFGHWDHDEEYGGGRACWGPKLVALGYSGAPTSSPKVAEVILEGPVFDWGRPFKPKRGFNITTDWVDLKAKERHQLEIVTTEGTFVKTFPSSNGKTEEIKGDIIQYRVKSLENKPVFIKITLTPV